MMRLGVDIGYSSTKIMFENGCHHFPSVVGTADHSSFGLNSDEVLAVELSDGQEFMIGETAVIHSRFEQRQEDREWISSMEYYALFVAALSHVRKDNFSCRLVTGLPVAFYEQDRDELRARFMGEHWVRRNGRKAQRIRVDGVKIIPQPFGSLLANALNVDGTVIHNGLSQLNVGVIDVGGKTTNYLSVYRLGAISRETASINLGCWNLIRAIRPSFEAEFSELGLRDHELIQAVSQGWVRSYGQRVDIGGLVDPIIEPFAKQVITQASQLWGTAAKIDCVLVTGGGAHLLGHFIREAFPHATVVSDPVFANVEGYYNFSQRAFKNG